MAEQLGHLAYPIEKARIKLALCDVRYGEALEQARVASEGLDRIIYWGGDSADSLDSLIEKPGYELFEACDTAQDDVCLIAIEVNHLMKG